MGPHAEGLCPPTHGIPPEIGRFLSPDPFVQYPGMQGWGGAFVAGFVGGFLSSGNDLRAGLYGGLMSLAAYGSDCGSASPLRRRRADR